MIQNIIREKPTFEWDVPKKIFLKENVISEELCNHLIEYGEKNVTKGINKYSKFFSVDFDSCLLPLTHEVHNVLQATLKEIVDFYQFTIDFFEPYELKRYNKNCHFGRHIDNYYGLNIDLDRKITISIQLNNYDIDFKGGELVVFDKSFKINRCSIIAFPSFFSHEVKHIREGTRWSLINWAWGPYWK